ncbi:hypothetical protein F5Y00DRAFT_272423 [Daldinia vernicosa]|uniref:uncharacterized protein n=1 Tax=Daldinia vernicosa TaxID=114800 RepID=UPI0020076CB7|nr:uncharacterized protein F5Y00DRAFT_272423 [Daldinia vernicosa]KAI0852774.1 hypothetical protein F5Y00DRAFT_272423 [Daldinia vernicosa]
MSEVSERVAEALRHDFPKWVAEKEAREAAAAQKKEKDTEFWFVSNWAFHLDGVQEFTRRLRHDFQRVQVSYDLHTSWVRVRCLIADEAAVMAACQLILDDIVQRELAAELSSGNKVFPYRTPDIGELGLATAPPEIQSAASIEVWEIPEGLLGRGPNPLRLVTAEVLAKLQHITGCALALGGDGLAVFIGGKSPQEMGVVVRKLQTLANYAGLPYPADLTCCKSFIYAEDKQQSPGTFVYMGHERKPTLSTFFLDRSVYRLGKDGSVYGKMFGQGVVVALAGNDSQPTKGPAKIAPSISPEYRNEPYRAFSPSMWSYKPKSRAYGSDKVLFNPKNNPQVVSWVTQLPNPEYNQGLSQQPSYKHQSTHLDDKNVGLPSLMPPDPQAETIVERSAGTSKDPEILPAEQDLILFDEQQTEELSASINKESEKTSITQPGTQAPQHPPASEIEPDDPFIKLWKGARIGELRVEPSIPPPPRHSTMRQQAGRRYDGLQVRGSDPDPELARAIVKRLVRMMGSLEIFTGKVSLKAELGRFCLTKINHDHVYLKGSACQDKVKSLQDIKDVLDRHHVRPQDLIFTKILTGQGEDANYIAFAEGSDKQRLWVPTDRKTIYEIYCCAKIAGEKFQKFILEVDAKDFTYRIYELDGDSCAVFVHCPKRVWDFQVTLTKSQDLSLTYGNFAKDLIDSMRVINQDSGIPLLEFIVKGVYQAEIMLVRTRNIASYARKGGNIRPLSNTSGSKSSTTSILEICEVHDMASRIIGRANNNVTIMFEQYRGNPQRGQLPTWYEASLQSKEINKALKQNRDLEIGEEVSWTPQQLRQEGAFDEIIKSATEMVKKIDGVGYWGNNFQDATIHKIPPWGKETSSQHPTFNPFIR